MSIFQPTDQAMILPARAIGPFIATVTIEESAVDELEITQHPVQYGSSITDNAFLKPAIVTVRVIFDDTEAPLAETYEKLRKLQSDRIPFDVITGKRVYRNMLARSLSQTTDFATENILDITIELQEIIVVQVTTTTVPPRALHAAPGKTAATEKAGQKATQPVPASQSEGPQRQRSALKILVGP